ncbi:AMP-binding protein [Rhodoplanes sp. TEM]|uniref:AMP-binding protein n=1 Tax=Rhodoplanes tepidamans TaxID=200616 RepID=A0ABT5J766_RHOTP|nr:MULTISPECIES: AMP-binding protein [Rhodoplanes]MDC7785226.1 AMP-binding protein [Rhodoplanes tepidamans]MDC7986422.1 AMP-binding protein [Rhodoplanes sp. TEM]MDQ0353484.1 phenylacetate-coenzyme A ligase PaaK-like adenylate-forming protein [Rhodoplanes tepidamans]
MGAATLDAWTARRMGLALPLTREAVEAWQVARLAERVAAARATSPFYRTRPDWPDLSIASREDVARLPFTRPSDLLRNDPPLVALSQSEVARIVTLPSSGTSGVPKRLHFTADELEATLDFFGQGMGLFTRAGDRVAILFAGERPGSVGDALSTALRRLGAVPMPIPATATAAEAAAMIRAARPMVVAGPPVRLLAIAREHAIDGGAPVRLRAALASSERLSPAVARALAQTWGCGVHDHWGMTETGYGGAVDCARHAGCHLREADLFVEIVDPDTGAPRPPGALGEVVVTTLQPRAVPLVRYRTGDLARLIEAPCACGSVLRRLADFSGRIGAAVPLPGGGALTLEGLDDALFAVPAVADFTARVDGGDPLALDLAVAIPARLCTPRTFAAVRLAVDGAPPLRAAIARGAVTVRVALVGAVRHDGKRRLLGRAA